MNPTLPNPTADPGQGPEPDLPEPQTASDREADRQARIEYLQSLSPQKPKRHWPKVVGLVVLLLALAGGGVTAYLATADKDKTEKPKASSNQPATNVPETTAVVSATEPFDSTLFGLSINYPKKWEAAEREGKLTITSPAMRLQDPAGKAITGQVVIGITAKGQGLTAFDGGNATAVLESEKLTYKQPTAVQRAQTYLSFGQYAVTKTLGAMDGMFVTGNFGYLKGQAIPKVDMVKLDPVISVTFLKCVDATCTTAAAAPIAASEWQKPAFMTPIKTTIESLAINE